MSRRVLRSIPKPAEPGLRSYLLLVAHDPARSRATLLPIALGAGAPRPLARREVGKVLALETLSGPRALAAHDGGTRAVVVEGEGDAIQAKEIALDGRSSRSIPLSRAPAALLLAGRTLLLGETGGVSYLDLEGDAPPRPVVTRSEVPGKAYDVFARDGDLVIAIDDIVVPAYGDSIRLGPAPEHVAAFALPGIVNGSYRLAALARTSGDAGTLYAVAPYVVLEGVGQYVAAMPVSGGRVAVEANAVLPSGRFPVLEEFTLRDTGRPTGLIAGDTMTPFTGLAVARRGQTPFRVVLAAGSRGLIALPPDLQKGTPAELIDLGAPCADVLADGDRLWALAGATLVELSASSGRLVPVERIALPARYQAFVH